MNRWWVYQRERFPVVGHGALIGAFSWSAVCYSQMQRGGTGLPEWRAAVVALVSSFLFFLQLRIADEFKDAEDDAKFRPYRPVPRGLVTLRELGRIGWAARLIQLGLAVWIAPGLVALLVACWAYMELMNREFLIAVWLKAHPVHYLWTHMLVLPLIDFYVTACDWWVHGAVPDGLWWLLAVTFFNGLAIELGRKLRAAPDEEVGVETYSALWGPRRAVAVWLGALAMSGVFGFVAAASVGFGFQMAVLLAVMVVAVAVVAARFLKSPKPGAGKQIEAISGVWAIGVYLMVGLVPAVWRAMW